MGAFAQITIRIDDPEGPIMTDDEADYASDIVDTIVGLLEGAATNLVAERLGNSWIVEIDQ